MDIEEEYVKLNYDDKKRYTHLAGIVPIAGQTAGPEQIWHNSYNLADNDLTFFEAAVINCAWMGCDTIWVVVDDDVSYFLRKRLGDSIKDPIGFDKMGQGFSWRWYRPRRRYIPIYYVKTDPRDWQKRDSIAYSVLQGARVASKICTSLTRWVAPDRYFISWPYSLYDASELSKQYRKIIKDSKNEYIFRGPQGTIKDSFLPAILSPETLNHARSFVWSNNTGIFNFDKSIGSKWWQLRDENGKLKFPKIFEKMSEPQDSLPDWASPSNVFKFLEPEELEIIELPIKEVYLVDTWENYRKYMGSQFQYSEEYNIIDKHHKQNLFKDFEEDIEDVQ